MTQCVETTGMFSDWDWRSWNRLFRELILLENKIFISLISSLIEKFLPQPGYFSTNSKENWTSLIFRHFQNKSYNISRRKSKVSNVLTKYWRMASNSTFGIKIFSNLEDKQENKECVVPTHNSFVLATHKWKRHHFSSTFRFSQLWTD